MRHRPRPRPKAPAKAAAAFLAIALHSALAEGQNAQRPPAFTSLRYDEDYSYLRDPALRTGDFFEKLKFIPIDSNAWAWLSVGDELRLRYERYQGNSFGSQPHPDEDYVRFRWLPYAGLHLGNDLTVFGQAIVAYGNRDPILKNPFIDQTGVDVVQGLVQWRALDTPAVGVNLRAGRQVLIYGSGRLINAGPNIRTAHDGAALGLRFGDWHADAFLVRPVKPGIASFDDEPDPSRLLWALYNTLPLPSMGPQGALDVYYIGFENDRAAFNQGKAVEHRHTLGSRFAGASGPVAWDLEANVQVGKFGGADIFAWSVATDEIYTYAKLAMKPWVGLRIAALSGDANPRDDKLGTFNPLFAEGGYFGENGVLGPANLLLSRATLGFEPASGWSVAGGATYYARASLGDGIYGLGMNLLRTDGESGARLVGPQFDFAVAWQATRNLGLAAAFSVIFPGGFVVDTGPAPTVLFTGGHVMFRY